MKNLPLISRAFNNVNIIFPNVTKVVYEMTEEIQGWLYETDNGNVIAFDTDNSLINVSYLEEALEEFYDECEGDKGTIHKKDIDFLGGWVATDIDAQQWCFVHDEDEGIFTYKEWYTGAIPEKITREIWENPLNWKSETILFNDLSEKEKNESISGYYGSLDEVKQLYGDSWKQIVVECYFETF